MPQRNLSFKLKNDISELDKLGRKLAAFGNRIGLSKKCVFQINLALDELFTNIVSYGFPDNGPQWISVTGIPFDPANAETPDPITEIEDCKVGGLGLHLVNKVMDEITYKRRNKKNIITLVKHIPKS